MGLPVRVATHLFRSAQCCAPPDDWTLTRGPLTWQLSGPDALLAPGRRFQLGLTASLPPASPPSGRSDVRRSSEWDVPPHAAYYRPTLAAGTRNVHPVSYVLFCDVLLLLTALDGGEALLDNLVDHGTGDVPFEDRWDWRSRIHLPRNAWRQIERTLRWAESPMTDAEQVATSLVDALDPCTPDTLSPDDFVRERVDILIDAKDEAEVARTVRPPDPPDSEPATSPDRELPQDLLLRETHLSDNLTVRIGQVQAWTPTKHVAEDFPSMDPSSVRSIMEQVAYAFQSPSHVGRDHAPTVVLLPEVSIPQPEVKTVRDLVASSGRASLAGLYWRELKAVYPATHGTSPSRKWIVNEAELVIPIGHDDRGPTSVRWYRVRKPLPAHVETGLAQTLTDRSPDTAWSMLKGYRWYRFVHPQWGDFTISICADLIDTAPWRSLRGELLHLFMVAFNQDVDLYDSLTWVRAYENYVNIVAVNHGSHGGSFLWTPRRSHAHELARLRGQRLFLIADVDIPVKALLAAQRDGVRDAVSREAGSWAGQDQEPSAFKSPPPGYERRAT